MDYNMHSQSYFDLLSKVYQKTFFNLTNHMADINKIIIEHLSQKVTDLSPDEGEDILPANGHDIYNYVARYGISNYQIQAVMNLDGHLNFETLTKAVMLSIQEEPIFGCRFVESEPPYWRRIKDLDQSMICSIEETDNLGESIQMFCESPLDMDLDPMVKVKLFRTVENDSLCFKINHACCDGIGAKEYIKLVSNFYTFLCQEDGVFEPSPKSRTRHDQDRLFAELGIPDPEAQWISGSEITRATWPFPWQQSQSNTGNIVVLQLHPAHFHGIKTYSKLQGAKINDLILTALYRAMSKMGTQIYTEPMEIPVTINLRRYLPDHKTEAIRNFSGSEITRVLLTPEESFNETLSKVTAEMDRIKNTRGGLQSAIGLERVEKLTLSETLAYYKIVSQWSYYCGDKCAPVLSNLGVLSNDLFTFGEQTVVNFYFVPPVVRPPGLLIMAGTYNDIITLSAGFYDGTVLREEIEELLGHIKGQLIDVCKMDEINDKNLSKKEC